MFESLREYWVEVWQIDAARWIIYITLIAIIATIGYYLGKLFRDMAIGGDGGDVDYLSEFERLKEAGKMGEFEYVRVRSKLEEGKKEKLQALLSDELPEDLQQTRPDFEEVSDESIMKPDSQDEQSESRD